MADLNTQQPQQAPQVQTAVAPLQSQQPRQRMRYQPQAQVPAQQSTQTSTAQSAAQPIAMSSFAPSQNNAPQSSAPPAATGYSLNRINPYNDLRYQTITPNQSTDRYGIAQTKFEDFAKSTDPYYAKTKRDLIGQGAAKGQLGSGMLRTSLGDAANLRNIQLDTAKSQFLTDALNNSIEDAYRNIGIAQQQQGRQDTQASNAFNQNLAMGDFGLRSQGQEFNQGLARAQHENATQGQLFSQDVTKAQLDNATQAQMFGQDVTQQQIQNALQNQLFGQGLATSQLEDSRQNQLFNQNYATQQLENSLQNQLFGQGVTWQDLLNRTQQQGFNQDYSTAQLNNATRSQLFGEDMARENLADQRQNTAFNQAQSQYGMQDQLTNSSFNRALQQLLAGNSGNPSDTSLMLSNIFGNQASAASGALGSLINNTVGNNAAQKQNNGIQELLRILTGGATTAPTATTPATNEPFQSAIPDSAFGLSDAASSLGLPPEIAALIRKPNMPVLKFAPEGATY